MGYKVWSCKIVVPAGTEIPEGFDSPPRSAAEQAVLEGGIPVVAVLSGWDGSLTEIEQEVLEGVDTRGARPTGVTPDFWSVKCPEVLCEAPAGWPCRSKAKGRPQTPDVVHIERAIAVTNES